VDGRARVRVGLALAFVSAVTAGGCGSDSPEPPEPEPQPLPTAAEVRDELTGLSFDDFIERSFELLLQRSPMSVVELGLEDEIDVGESFLDDMSDRFAAETQEVEETILEMAGEHDAAALDGEQRVAFEAYTWYLDDRVRAHAFADLDYRVTPVVNSAPVNTQLFFTDIHPVSSAGDADRYVKRLAAVGPQMRQVRDVMQRLDEEEGIMAPRLLISWSRPAIREIAQAQPRATAYYRALETKLAELAEGDPDAVDASARDQLLDRAAEAISDSVIPGYRVLDELLAAQEARAPDTVGAWQYPDGDAYYAHALRHHVTAEVTAAELHQLGQSELERIHGELAVRFAELGYPEGAAVDQQIARAAGDGGHVAEEDVVAAYTEIIDEAQGRLSEAFDVLPSAGVIVTGVPSGGFYVSPSLDNSRPGAFFATVRPAGEDRFGMRTLSYHEAVPGHHLQIGIAHDLDLPLFQRVVTFTGFVEGWALYAEWLAGDLGWYEGDIHGDIGRLQAEAFRAARLVVDTGIHDMEWSFDQAVDFFRENTGYSQGFAEGQIARYAAWPGQATSYWMGRTEILALRAAAEAVLGADFDQIAFHRAVLIHGSVPLEVLASSVEADLGLRAAAVTR
jgi:uncharacterized protein (DUF885 family)